jgi:hypothetical protein
MSERRQLLVRHRALDPTAWTALHALRTEPQTSAASGLSRASLWEFEWDGGAPAERLEEWVASANWFANPNRDRATWRASASDPTEMAAGAACADGTVGAGEPGAYLITAWREALDAPAHEAAATSALGCRVRVRRALVWWLGSEDGDPAAILAHAGGRLEGGLLVNPHSQSSWGGETIPVPAIGDWAGAAHASGGRE